MAGTGWVEDALVGTIIRTNSGINAIVDDVGDTGISLQSEASKVAIILPMRELRACVALWAALRFFPSERQVVELGIPAGRAMYLAPLVESLRREPRVGEWLREPRAKPGGE